MGSNAIRDGKGHRAYRRKRDSLKRRTKRDGLVCAQCGNPIDTTLPAGHPMAFTADHPQPVGRGGDLVKQDLRPMHNSCNSRRGDHVDVEVWEAS